MECIACINKGGRKMDKHSVTLVRSSWAHLDGLGPLVIALFFKNLLTVQPRAEAKVEGLFDASQHRRDILLMRGIGAVVERLDDPVALSSLLHELKRVISIEDLQEFSYLSFEITLIETLAQLGGGSLSAVLRGAWVEACRFTLGIMLKDDQPSPLDFAVPADRRDRGRREVIGAGGNRSRNRRATEFFTVSQNSPLDLCMDCAMANRSLHHCLSRGSACCDFQPAAANLRYGESMAGF